MVWTHLTPILLRLSLYLYCVDYVSSGQSVCLSVCRATAGDALWHYHHTLTHEKIAPPPSIFFLSLSRFDAFALALALALAMPYMRSFPQRTP